MNKQQLVAFIKSLKADSARLKALSQLLDQQYQALKERNTQELLTINEKALALMESVRSHQTARETALREFTGNKPGYSIIDFVNEQPKTNKRGCTTSSKRNSRI